MDDIYIYIFFVQFSAVVGAGKVAVGDQLLTMTWKLVWGSLQWEQLLVEEAVLDLLMDQPFIYQVLHNLPDPFLLPALIGRWQLKNPAASWEAKFKLKHGILSLNLKIILKQVILCNGCGIFWGLGSGRAS